MRNPAGGAILLLSALAGRSDPSLSERPNHFGDPIQMKLLASRTGFGDPMGALR